MTIYKAPLADFSFLFDRVLRLDALSNVPGFAEASGDTRGAILEEAGKLSEGVLLPLNESGDREGCRYDAKTHSVTTPKGFKEAYRQFTEGGWSGLASDPDYGGQGLPAVLALAVNEMVVATNWSFAMYPGLSHGAYSAIHTHGSEEQKATYLPKLVAGEWSGTMNLTEPQCGTDLGLIRTKAEPQKDGSYRITGTKIWISGGEQDLTANAIHLVLARISGAPEGIKGISLFIVPKFLVNADGTLGARNGVFCGGLEEKMGIHANATCVMNYEGATGYLIGEPHKGMRAMFTMMNEARLGVGLQGLAISEIAYQNAVAFARERLQGRSLTGPKNEGGPADPIIVHPDVRRMLMDVRAFNEGARALLLWTGLWGDLEYRSSDAKTREKGGDYMALLTPVLKAYFTDQGFQSAVTCQQVLGGSGFTKHFPIEQFVRDARIGMIYEGANGIQALDLVGRKLAQNGGRALFAFLADAGEVADALVARPEFKAYGDRLHETRKFLEDATKWLMENALANPDHAGASSYDYLYLTAYVALGLVWGRMVLAARKALDEGAGEKAFFEAKLVTARHFFERVLPAAQVHAVRAKAGADGLMALAAEAF
ncbi:MAG: acyl-CoA dehydrogenase C-terminal domain-containing protein [Alphaproteobacteria bacterium]|nr:acyl-CoA dehydrogenase C-terminal domain-containing protein [Alphaproteobacteria bacterium]